MISAYQIAKFIKGELVGEDLSIKGAIDLLPGEKSCISFLDEKLNKRFKIFEAAPAEARDVPTKKTAPDYFL